MVPLVDKYKNTLALGRGSDVAITGVADKSDISAVPNFRYPANMDLKFWNISDRWVHS